MFLIDGAFFFFILQGVSLNDIINNSKFTGNKREIVVSGIQRLDPQFKPIYTPPELKYKNCLLDSLNENIRPIEQSDYLPVMEILFFSFFRM